LPPSLILLLLSSLVENGAGTGWVRYLIIKNLECKYSTKVLSNKNENKALTLWETNSYYSLNKKKNLTKFERNIIQVSKFNESIIIGLLLSDGYIEKRMGWNPRIRLEQSFKNFEYLWYLFKIFFIFNSSYPVLIKRMLRNKIFYSLCFKTRQLSCFNKFYTLFYFNNKKIIKPELYNYIDYISIAHWIQGDGSKSNKGLILCTDSYSIKEVIILMNILKIKFQIDSSIHYHTSIAPDNKIIKKKVPRIYINGKNLNKIKPFIKPYFVKSMLYKID